MTRVGVGGGEGAGEAGGRDAAALFAGPGELRARCRALDWAATPLGPVAGWPQSLRTAVALCLASGFPMIVMWGPELVQVYNDAMRAVLQAKHPAGLGQRARDCWPELWAMIGPMYQGVLDTGESIFLEDQLFTPERRGRPGVPEEAYFTFSYSAIPDEALRPAGILATAVETTRHVQSRSEREAALERANADLRAAASERERLLLESEAARARSDAVLASIADAFYLLDHHWRFTYVNDVAEPLLQTPRERLLGRTLWEAFPGVVGSPFEGPYREAMATGRVTSAEAYFPPLGTWFDVRTYPWAGGLMVHFRDIGARKAAEAERERLLADAQAARAEAEAANRAKSEFLAVMSHELRTPLNAIGGYAELIELGIHGPVTSEQRTALARIQTSQRHLLGLIAGVLDYSRVEAGAVTYRLADVPVAEAVAEAEALVAPQLRAKGLGYAWSGAPPELCVRADREKLQQILLNLLGNAIKFTEARDGVPGRIEVTCSGAPAGGDHSAAGAGRHDAVCVHIRDTGVGIAPEKLAGVFEPFVQADQRLTRRQEGVGLGLAISRDLARGMGGDLTAESTPGVGSTFTLTLPRA